MTKASETQTRTGALAVAATGVVAGLVAACARDVPTGGSMIGCDAKALAILVTRRGDVPWSTGQYTFELTQGGITERCQALFREGIEPTYDCSGLLHVQRLAVCTQERVKDIGVAFPCDAAVPTSVVLVHRPDTGDDYRLRIVDEIGTTVLEAAGPLTYRCRLPDSCECSLARVDLTVD